MILSKGQKVYQVIINVILVLVTLTMILPLLLLFMSSITDENTLVVNGYSLFPEKFSLYAYEYIISNSATLMRAYGISIVVTVIGTTGCLLLSTLMAFPLSLKNLPGRRFLSFFVLVIVLIKD